MNIQNTESHEINGSEGNNSKENVQKTDVVDTATDLHIESITIHDDQVELISADESERKKDESIVSKNVDKEVNDFIDLDEPIDLEAPRSVNDNNNSQVITITEDLDATDTLAVDDSTDDERDVVKSSPYVDITGGNSDESSTPRGDYKRKSFSKSSVTINISDDDDDNTESKKSKPNDTEEMDEETILNGIIATFHDELNTDLVE